MRGVTKHTNIHTKRITDRDRRERSGKIFKEIMAERCPKLMKVLIYLSETPKNSK